MKVLTASRGHDDDDYTGQIVPGELVAAPPGCGEPGCGCDRAWRGLGSGATTTVAAVAEAPIGVRTLAAMIRTRFADWGWSMPASAARDAARELADVARLFPPGTEVRHDGPRFTVDG